MNHEYERVFDELLVGEQEKHILIKGFHEYKCKKCDDILPHFYRHVTFEDALRYLAPQGDCNVLKIVINDVRDRAKEKMS